MDLCVFLHFSILNNVVLKWSREFSDRISPDEGITFSPVVLLSCGFRFRIDIHEFQQQPLSCSLFVLELRAFVTIMRITV